MTVILYGSDNSLCQREPTQFPWPCGHKHLNCQGPRTAPGRAGAVPGAHFHDCRSDKIGTDVGACLWHVFGS